jgi:hypothetical protein
MPLINLSRVFTKFCLKVIDLKSMPVLKVEVVKTMSTLKKVFHLACFDVITHLVIHLVEELDLYCSVHTQWMYPMER